MIKAKTFINIHYGSVTRMKVRYLTSAAIVVEDGENKILCDPWLIDGAYYGAWCHYPEPDFQPEDFHDVDYIYISHIHPDHFHPPTLQRMNSEIPVIIHDYANDYLKDSIEELDHEVLELPHNERRHLVGDLHINILAADSCDPELCGNYFGCSWYTDETDPEGSAQVDTMAAIDNGEHVVVNMNDCPYPMAERSMREIKTSYGDIDLVCHQYSAAQFYPQCMTDYTHKEKIEAKQDVILEKQRLAKEFINIFDTDYYMPFAGEYTLAGSLSGLNRYTANPPRIQAYNYFVENINTDKHRCVFLNADEFLDLEAETVSSPYTPIDPVEKHKYIKEELAEREFTYESDELPSAEELEAYLPDAYSNLENKRKKWGFQSETTVLVSLGEDNTYADISMSGNGYEIVESPDLDTYDGYVKFDLDPRLLKRIFEGPEHAHWADAKIGSHLGIAKEPDIYERGIYEAMSAFTC